MALNAKTDAKKRQQSLCLERQYVPGVIDHIVNQKWSKKLGFTQKKKKNRKKKRKKKKMKKTFDHEL